MCFCAVGKDVCPLSGASIREWIIVKSNNCLKDRIKEWARRQLLDLDAIEVAALKLRSKAALGLQNKLEGQIALRRQQRGDIRRWVCTLFCCRQICRRSCYLALLCSV